MGPARLKLFSVLIGCVVLLLQGCVSVPAAYLVVGQRKSVNTIDIASNCDPNSLAHLPTYGRNQSLALDPEGFSLMNWNMLKCRRQGWEKDFYKLSKNSDVITIQEAYLAEGLQKVLRLEKLNWNLATAFEYQGATSGVLTASKILPEVLCMLRVKEPLINIPKTILLTRYPISSRLPFLVIVNVHSINFTLDTADFLSYWRQLEDILKPHNGPLIVAGDLNTWNSDRLGIVKDKTRRLGLQPVQFKPDIRTTIFGFVVDHVYYRGLVPLKASVYEVETSDHNPMVVTFKLDAR